MASSSVAASCSSSSSLPAKERKASNASQLSGTSGSEEGAPGRTTSPLRRSGRPRNPHPHRNETAATATVASAEDAPPALSSSSSSLPSASMSPCRSSLRLRRQRSAVVDDVEEGGAQATAAAAAAAAAAVQDEARPRSETPAAPASSQSDANEADQDQGREPSLVDSSASDADAAKAKAKATVKAAVASTSAAAPAAAVESGPADEGPIKTSGPEIDEAENDGHATEGATGSVPQHHQQAQHHPAQHHPAQPSQRHPATSLPPIKKRRKGSHEEALSSSASASAATVPRAGSSPRKASHDSSAAATADSWSGARAATRARASTMLPSTSAAASASVPSSSLRKGSHDSTSSSAAAALAALGVSFDLDLGDVDDVGTTGPGSSSLLRKESHDESGTISKVGPAAPAPATASTNNAAAAPSADASNERKTSDADNHSFNSGTSSGQRMLLEAMMMTTAMNPAAAGDPFIGKLSNGASGASVASQQSTVAAMVGTNLGRTTASAAAAASSQHLGVAASSTASHSANISATAPTSAALGATAAQRERLESWGGGVRERLESWGGLPMARDRLESWGGMSDLSIPHGGGSGGGGGLALGVGSGLGGDDDAKPPAVASSSSVGGASKSVPTRISLHHPAGPQRDRLNSVASLSEVSVGLPPVLFDLDGLGGVGPGGMGIGGASIGSGQLLQVSDLQAYVAAAVASVGDQLIELAEAVENAASGADDVLALLKHGPDSETSSVASPMIGAVTDGARHGTRSARGASLGSSVSGLGRPRTWSTGSGKLSVDYEAVQAAIDAAHAAAGSFDASSSVSVTAPITKSAPIEDSSKADARRATSRRKLPITRRDNPSRPRSKRKKSRADDSDADETTGSAAALQPGGSAPSVYKKAPPLKKRAKRNSSDNEPSQHALIDQTPVLSNRAVLLPPDDASFPPMVVSSDVYVTAEKDKAAGNMKWDAMYSALLEFAKDREEIETKNMSADQKLQWAWDGHVPTNFKTKDGKALGRWVNNQRSAKGKGTLKDDREDRLVAAGLKWTEQRSTGWNIMFNELKFYIESQAKVGRTWDGNVPTGFQIKARPGSNLEGEDRNLGRWVNRQRSMFHAGRLQKDRQLELESVGLKWSMIQIVSWDTMYDALVAYVGEQKSSNGGTWDGNVPTGYRTTGEPPRALGRWINRQRSAYAKNRLKDEYKEKLCALGLKWSLREGQQPEASDKAGYDSDASDEAEGRVSKEAHVGP